MVIINTILNNDVFVRSHSMDVPRCTLPFPISAILADEAFEIPRLGRRCNLPHKLLVDLDPQTGALERLDETILDGESFRVRDVAVDVVLTSCIA